MLARLAKSHHRWAIERAVASDYKQDRLYAEHGNHARKTGT